MTKIKGIAIFLVFIGLLAIVGYSETHYSQNARVRAVIADEVRLETEDGNLWVCYADGFHSGDHVKVTFYNNRTDLEIEDDEIVKIQKK